MEKNPLMLLFLEGEVTFEEKRLRFTYTHTHWKPEKMCQLVEFFFTLERVKILCERKYAGKKGKMFELRRKCVSSFAILFANFTHFSIPLLPTQTSTHKTKGKNINMISFHSEIDPFFKWKSFWNFHDKDIFFTKR